MVTPVPLLKPKLSQCQATVITAGRLLVASGPKTGRSIESAPFPSARLFKVMHRGRLPDTLRELLPSGKSSQAEFLWNAPGISIAASPKCVNQPWTCILYRLRIQPGNRNLLIYSSLGFNRSKNILRCFVAVALRFSPLLPHSGSSNKRLCFRAI